MFQGKGVDGFSIAFRRYQFFSYTSPNTDGDEVFCSVLYVRDVDVVVI